MKPSLYDRFQNSARLSALLLCAAVMAACSEPQDDLGEWTRKEFASVKPHADILPAPRRFVPEVYRNEQDILPFDGGRVFPQDRKQTGPTDPLVQAELRRPKQVLEAFTVEQLKMVGSLQRGGKRFALVQAGGLIYNVQPGQYMGDNFGRVTQITETEISLRELVLSDDDVWTQRVSKLALQEK